MQGFQDFANKADALKGIFHSVTQAEQMAHLAIGRIFRMGSRPSQAGDLEQFDECKTIIMNAKEYLDIFS